MDNSERECFLQNELPKLYNYARKYKQSLAPDGHEDIVNEVFTRPGHLSRIWVLESDDARRSYLRFAVDYMAKERLKRKRQSINLDDTAMLADKDRRGSSKQLRDLFNALNMLEDESQRLAFLFRFETGATYKEIADLIGETESKIPQLLKNACRQLRRSIASTDTSRFSEDWKGINTETLLSDNPEEIRILKDDNNSFKESLQKLPNRQHVLIFDCRKYDWLNLAAKIEEIHRLLERYLPAKSVATVFVVVPKTETDQPISIQGTLLECETSKTDKEIMRAYLLRMISFEQAVPNSNPMMKPSREGKFVSRKFNEIVGGQFGE